MLRDRADAAYKAGKIGKAAEHRHAALIAIGYKVDEASGAANGLSRGSAAAPLAKSPGSVEGPAARGCTAGATRWVAPAE
jgi:hypothetical protein